jgi:TRAP-type C4-dicarboxylate transport system permease small subunit
MNADRAPASFSAAARAVRVLAWLQLSLAMLILVAATLVYGAEIVMRSFFNTSYPDYYEVVGISFIYVFLFGAGALYARNEDIVIDTLYGFAPRRAKPWWVMIVHIVVALTMVLVLIYTVQLIGLQRSTPTPLLGIPEAVKWWPLAAVSVSMIYSSLVEAWSCALEIISGTRPKTWPNPMFDHDPAEDAIV